MSFVPRNHFMKKILATIAAKLDYDDEQDHFGDKPKPCPCGDGTTLDIIETQAKLPSGYSARVAVKCPSCGKQGIDTCHDQQHAIRRWNWFTS